MRRPAWLQRRRRIAAALALVLVAPAALAGDQAGALAGPVPGIDVCTVPFSIYTCGSAGQFLEDTLAVDLADGLPSATALGLGPATSVLFLTGDSAPTSLVVQGCADRISANGGFPAFASGSGNGWLAGAQTAADCSPVQLLQYGVYSAATMATQPFQRSFCAAVLAAGAVYGLGSGWAVWSAANGWPSGLQGLIDVACPAAWRPFFAGTGAAPANWRNSALATDMPKDSAGNSAYCAVAFSAPIGFALSGPSYIAGYEYLGSYSAAANTKKLAWVTCNVSAIPRWLNSAGNNSMEFGWSDLTLGATVISAQHGWSLTGTGGTVASVFAPGAGSLTWRIAFPVPAAMLATDMMGSPAGAALLGATFDPATDVHTSWALQAKISTFTQTTVAATATASYPPAPPGTAFAGGTTDPGGGPVAVVPPSSTPTSVGTCVSGAGFGLDPGTWLPALANVLVCVAQVLFVPTNTTGLVHLWDFVQTKAPVSFLYDTLAFLPSSITALGAGIAGGTCSSGAVDLGSLSANPALAARAPCSLSTAGGAAVGTLRSVVYAMFVVMLGLAVLRTTFKVMG